MKIFKKLKKKHYFSFEKTFLTSQDESDELFYRAIKDTYLFLKAKTIANNTNCELITFNIQELGLEGRIIVLYATKDDFMNFCSEFCSIFKKYIENIEIK